MQYSVFVSKTTYFPPKQAWKEDAPTPPRTYTQIWILNLNLHLTNVVFSTTVTLHCCINNRSVGIHRCLVDQVSLNCYVAFYSCSILSTQNFVLVFQTFLEKFGIIMSPYICVHYITLQAMPNTNVLSTVS